LYTVDVVHDFFSIHVKKKKKKEKKKKLEARPS